MSRKPLRLRPDAEWPGIIDRVLEGASPAEQDAAREILWVDVSNYVVQCRNLPIGPLNEDEDARRDIAVCVLRKLELASYKELRKWRAGNRAKGGSWWRFIRWVTIKLSIDFARTSRQNVARRSDGFQWVRVAAVDPFVLGDILESTYGASIRAPLDLAIHSSPDELIEILTLYQNPLRADTAPAGAKGLESREPPPSVPSASTGDVRKRR